MPRQRASKGPPTSSHKAPQTREHLRAPQPATITNTPQGATWAGLFGACPACGRLLAHLESSALCMSCGWTNQPEGRPLR